MSFKMVKRSITRQNLSIRPHPKRRSEVSKYLKFKKVTHGGYKTKRFQVCSAKYDFPLGEIRFYNFWRQYCFFPFKDTVFNNTCMGDIIKFIKGIKSMPIKGASNERD